MNFQAIPRTAVRDITDTVCAYLPADRYAEGQRARRAGLNEPNPYVLWPCVAEQWAAGFKGEVE